MPIKTYKPASYEGRFERSAKVFSERTVVGGLLIPLADYATPPDSATNQTVVIVAKPQ